ELKETIRDVLLDPRTLQRGYFDQRAVRFLLDEHFSGRRNEPGRIWRLLILELWHRNFMESSLKDIAAGNSFVLCRVARVTHGFGTTPSPPSASERMSRL